VLWPDEGIRSALGQQVFNGLRDVMVSDAFNWPVEGPDLYAFASPRGSRFQRA
jgi:hypothetical protein